MIQIIVSGGQTGGRIVGDTAVLVGELLERVMEPEAG